MKRNKKTTGKKRPNSKTAKSKTLKGISVSLKSRLKTFRPWQRALVYVFVGIFLLTIVLSAIEAAIPPVKNPVFGVSFSTKYAEELGLDWQETYTALLDDLEIRNYRLMSYWDDTEPKQGSYEFADLDWQMDEAAKRGATVSLSLGLRQPRWPECHRPDWYPKLPREEQDKALFKFLETVVNRYKSHPALISYQLENEAVNSWFGTCTDKDIDTVRLQKEFDYVKSLDSMHPVWMSLSDQHGLPVNGPVPDKYGYSVYRIVWNDKTAPFKFYLTYPTPVWYHRSRALWISAFKDRDIFIHELQLEPWAPEATVNVSIEEQDKSMDVKQMEENVLFARKIGRNEIYTWGGEWWYWRKTTLNDPTIWEKARELLRTETN